MEEILDFIWKNRDLALATVGVSLDCFQPML